MIVHIHDGLRVSDIQDRFAKCFPCLKIEFYDKAHRFMEPSDEKNRIVPEKWLREIRKNHATGELEIKSWDTVEKVEEGFKKKFGLNVQVFRKEIRGWVQTSKTDKYNLLEQAEMVCFAYENLTAKFNEQLGEYDL